MRLATAGDELQVLRDPRVKADEGYPQTLLLSRVITALGTLPEVIEGIITGRALYEGSFSLEDALAVVEG